MEQKEKDEKGYTKDVWCICGLWKHLQEKHPESKEAGYVCMYSKDICDSTICDKSARKIASGNGA